MGVDFLYTKRHWFKRGWDQGKKDLAQPNLFSGAPSKQSRSIQLYCDGGELHVGDEVLLRSTPTGITAFSCQNQSLGACKSPPSDILSAVKAAGGVALGKVCKFHPISKSADVEVR